MALGLAAFFAGDLLLLVLRAAFEAFLDLLGTLETAFLALGMMCDGKVTKVF